MEFNSFSLTKSVYGNYRLVHYKEKGAESDTTYLRNYEEEADSRAQRIVLDLAQNNRFDWFVTFTFDQKKIDREDIKICKARFLKALANYKKRFDVQIKYIACPEWHEKHDAIHFHCLMSGLFEPDMEYKGPDRKTGRPVWRINYFFSRFGAVNAVKIQEYNKFVAYYISKYMGKNCGTIFDNRYFRSKGLKMSDKIWNGCFQGDIGLTPVSENNLCRIYEFGEDSFADVVKKIVLFNDKVLVLGETHVNENGEIVV